MNRLKELRFLSLFLLLVVSLMLPGAVFLKTTDGDDFSIQGFEMAGGVSGSPWGTG